MGSLFSEQFKLPSLPCRQLEEYEPLVNFCVGRDKQSDFEVNRTARKLYVAISAPQLVVLMNHGTKEVQLGPRKYPVLMGLCSVYAKPLDRMPETVKVPSDAGIYVNAIGLDLDFQGQYAEDPATGATQTLGDVLLESSLASAEQSAYLTSLSAASYAWALVLDGNTKSIEMFKRAGFKKYPPREPGGQSVMYRPAEPPPAE